MTSLNLSTKARRTEEQPINALIVAALADPNLINLAAGLVDADTLPVEEVAQAAKTILSDSSHGRGALQYETTQGLAEFRRAALEHLAKLEEKSAPELGLSPEDLIITTGSQQALYLIGDALIDPGDIVITSNPSYFVYTGTLASFGAKMIAVPADEDGMDVEEVQKVLARLTGEGRLGRVKMIYCTSYFDNPTGLTLSIERRKRLVEIVKRIDSEQRILILEDAAYRELRYDGEALASIKSFDPANAHTIITCTFSKPFAPGIKTGYTAMPGELLHAVLQQKGNHDFGSASLTQHIAMEVLASGLYARQVEKLTANYRKKRDIMLAALEKHMPMHAGVSWTKPKGGLYVWLTLPEGLDTRGTGGMFRTCVERGVIYVPGDYAYQPDERGKVPTNHLRLSFGNVPTELIEPGIERLAAVVKELLATDTDSASQGARAGFLSRREHEPDAFLLHLQRPDQDLPADQRRAGRDHELWRFVAPPHRAGARCIAGGEDAVVLHAGDDHIFAAHRGAVCHDHGLWAAERRQRDFGVPGGGDQLRRDSRGGDAGSGAGVDRLARESAVSVLHRAGVHAEGGAGDLFEPRAADCQPDRSHAPDQVRRSYDLCPGSGAGEAGSEPSEGAARSTGRPDDCVAGERGCAQKAPDDRLMVPKEFYLARRATVFIRPSHSGDEFTLEAKLEGGAMFPRRFDADDATQGGMAATDYGPMPIQSPIKEDTKFMDISRLHALEQDLSKSRRVQEQLQRIVREQQEAALLKAVYSAVNHPGGAKTLVAGSERYDVIAPANSKATLDGGKLVLAPAKFVEYRDGQLYRTSDAGELDVTCEALPDDRITVSTELRDVVSVMRDGKSERRAFPRSFVVPATVTTAAIESRGLEYFQTSPQISLTDRLAFLREKLKIGNAVESEMHARASFAVSCLILVVAGCWLGMMFRSGNFLTRVCGERDAGAVVHCADRGRAAHGDEYPLQDRQGLSESPATRDRADLERQCCGAGDRDRAGIQDAAAVTVDVHETERVSMDPPRVWMWVGLGLLAFIGLRLWFNATHWLVPDEAVYWTWSRHLALGYLDHPPMVAYLIHLSTMAFGSTELGVRMPALVFAAGSALVLIGLARMLDDDWRVTAFMAVVWLGSPLLLTLGTIITPDTPTFFFSACGLVCAVAAVRAEAGSAKWWWLAFGLSCGLALLTKYTAVLLPASVGLALLFNREGRVHLQKPWIYLAGVIAVAVFSPVLWWNAHRGWVSFEFQLHHGSESAEPPGLLGLVAYAGGQLAVWTPVLFVIGIVVLVHFWRRVFGRSASAPAWLSILLWAGTVPLVFFAIMATRAHGEVNWPAFAYAPISILTALYLAENWQGERVGWARIGCTVAIVGAVFMHVPRLLFLMHIRPSPLVQMYESKPFGEMLDRMADGRTIVCNRHQDAAKASFYMKGQPDIWAVSFGSRPTAYDYMTGRPDFAKMARVLFVGYHYKPFCQAYGFDVQRKQEVPLASVKKKKRMVMLVALDRVPAGTQNVAVVQKVR